MKTHELDAMLKNESRNAYKQAYKHLDGETLIAVCRNLRHNENAQDQYEAAKDVYSKRFGHDFK
jgi:response regulator of citrate/malate metabolism